jgi:hypothetical protein
MRLPLMCLLLAGCGDKGGEDSGQDDAVNPTFSAVYDDVLVPSCAYSTCHLGAGNAGLGWDDAQGAYEALVSVPSTQVGTMDRVSPGAPDDSYLVWKLEEADGIVDDVMPPSVPLTSDKLDLVRDWINAGALND